MTVCQIVSLKRATLPKHVSPADEGLPLVNDDELRGPCPETVDGGSEAQRLCVSCSQYYFGI